MVAFCFMRRSITTMAGRRFILRRDPQADYFDKVFSDVVNPVANQSLIRLVEQNLRRLPQNGQLSHAKVEVAALIQQ
jgi:hypothetical protein